MNLKGLTTTIIGLTLILTLGWGCSADQPTPRVAFDQEYQQFERLLGGHVDKAGLVDYEGLRQDSLLLDSVVEAFAMVPAATLQTFSQDEQLAFWINAYNALTLSTVAQSYPIQSIRDLPGNLSQERYPIGGQNLTLADIEQKILRGEFKEPRVNFAVASATRSGPALSRHAYRATNLEEQLESAAFRFLVDTTRNRFIPAMKRMELSELFNACGSDFVKPYWSHYPTDQDELNRAVLNFISQRLPRSLTGPLREEGWTITYRPVDWTLNDQGRTRASTAMTE